MQSLTVVHAMLPQDAVSACGSGEDAHCVKFKKRGNANTSAATLPLDTLSLDNGLFIFAI
jgi:hypothetical protein